MKEFPTKGVEVQQDDIVDAINSRIVIVFDYDGHPRQVVPAAVGLSTTGKTVLRGYQIGGSSSSGVLPKWRLFSLAKMFGGSSSGDVFPQTPPGFERGDRGMTAIFAEL